MVTHKVYEIFPSYASLVCLFPFRNSNATIGEIGTLTKGEKYRMRINFYKDDKGDAKFYVKRNFSGSHTFFTSAETRAISAG